MEDSGPLLHQLGAFEPSDVKKVLGELERLGIAFELEADHSALGEPNRALQLYFGLYPEGSKLLVFVREPDLARAEDVVRRLFPV